MRNKAWNRVHLLKMMAIIAAGFHIAGCAAFYVDRSERMVLIDSDPQGAYVWDSAGTKLLGQTPMQLQLKPNDYTVHRLFITKSDYYDETIKTYDLFAGMGLGMLDAVFVVPFFVDLITLTPSYGKYTDTNFVVRMTPTSIPRPGAIVGATYQQEAARAQAMVGAAQATSQAISQGANAVSSAMVQQQQISQPVAARQPVVQNQPATVVVAQPAATVQKPNTKRWCSRTYKSGGMHGEWDTRFSPGCPACRGTINF